MIEKIFKIIENETYLVCSDIPEGAKKKKMIRKVLMHILTYDVGISNEVSKDLLNISRSTYIIYRKEPMSDSEALYIRLVRSNVLNILDALL